MSARHVSWNPELSPPPIPHPPIGCSHFCGSIVLMRISDRIVWGKKKESDSNNGNDQVNMCRVRVTVLLHRALLCHHRRNSRCSKSYTRETFRRFATPSEASGLLLQSRLQKSITVFYRNFMQNLESRNFEKLEKTLSRLHHEKNAEHCSE